MSLINTKIPEFTAPAFHNGEIVDIDSANFAGKWAIMFFYPADFTFVCPTELGDLQDQYSDLQAMGVDVYSVSTDTPFVHKAWHEASDTIGKIEYPMIADPTHAVSLAFDNLRPDEGVADRATFLIDPDGVIQFFEITAEGIGRNAAELVRKVRAAQYVREHPGEVCPAKWEEGDDTLTPGLDLVGKI